jgi:nitronate monooxygenase/enoyl-[acyl-carrier protein] reductase II
VTGTPFCRRLGVEHPIWSVGMGMAAGPELAAAVSNAGGLGVVGTQGESGDGTRRLVARTRELTGRPFGVNLVIAGEDDEQERARLLEVVGAAVAERVAAVVLFWGDPAPSVRLARGSGVSVVLQVGSVAEAEAAAAAGVDAVIAQGIEAGGHLRGVTSIWELLPATVAALAPLPVLAAGGIGDGAGVARALRLGAQGVSLGTRFVASDEAAVHPAHKRRIVESTAADTVHTELYDAWWPDAPHRTLRNRTFREWEAAGRPPPGRRPGEGTVIGTRPLRSGEVQPWPRYAVGIVPPGFEGDLDAVPMLVGESCTVVHDVKPAAEIVREFARDVAAALA